MLRRQAVLSSSIYRSLPTRWQSGWVTLVCCIIPGSLDQLVIGRQREFDVDCNWKLFLEVFNEYYHLPHVHPESINHRYPEPDPADIVMGEYTSQFGVTCGNPALLDGQEEQAFPRLKHSRKDNAAAPVYSGVPEHDLCRRVDCLWMYHVFH